MVCSSVSKTKALQEKQRCKQRRIALLSAVVGGAIVMQYMTPHLIESPMYDSKLSGEDWVKELLHGHPGWFHDSLGMSKHVFQKLVQEHQMYAGLKDSKQGGSAIFFNAWRLTPPLPLPPKRKY